MAQFVQSDALSPIQGSAGQFSPVVNKGPTLAEGIASVTKTVGGLVDTAGNIYGQNRAESLVEEEIEQIDKARAIAESGEFTAGDAVPESLKLDQREWDMLSTAVQSGTMSREKARLIAGSRLRSRIAEEPFFADRMRKAASGVLGFNIESEGARQYFASFPTEGEIGQGGGKTQQDKWWDQAEAISAANGIPADKIYKQIAAAEYGKYVMDIAQQERDAGIITDQEAFTTFNREQSKLAFTGIIGAAQQIYQQEGAVKEEQMERIIAESMNSEINQLAQLWKGDQSSSEYQRAAKVIEDRYEGYRTFVKSVGFDALQQIAVDRNARERELFTDKTMTDVKIINEAAGQEGVKAYFNYISPLTNATQKAQMLQRFPLLKRFVDLEGMTPDAVAERLKDTASRVASKQPLKQEDEGFVGAVATDMHNQAETPEEKTSLFDYLIKEGLKTTGLSIIAGQSPNRTSTENVQSAKRAYQEDIEPLLTQLGREVEQWGSDVNRFGMPALEVRLNEAGDIEVFSQRPMSLPQGKLNELKQNVAYINQFNKMHKNGWSEVLGESPETYNIKVQQLLDEGRKMTQNSQFVEEQDLFARAVNNGQEDIARNRYEELRKQHPNIFHADFDIVYAEMRRRRLAAMEGGE